MNDKSKKLEIKNNNDSDNDFIIEEEVDNTKKTDSLPKDTNLYTESTKDDDFDVKPSLNDFVGNSNDIFSTYKQKYENTMSSAVILLFFGIIGLVSTVLFISGIIKLPISTLQYIILFAIYLVFLVFGFISYKKALEYKLLINDENNKEDNIEEFLEKTVSNKLLKQLTDKNLSDEENYMIYISKIKEKVLERYPNYDENLIEYHIDDYLNKHF